MENKVVEIVLVEDNRFDAEMAIRALKKSNVSNNIVHLQDGREALDFFSGEGQFKHRNLNIRPNVILLDLKMPKMDGIGVLRALKANPATKTIPIVILTSSNEDPDIKRCYELGANSYIIKPVGFENFTKCVNDLGLYWVLLNEPLQ